MNNKLQKRLLTIALIGYIIVMIIGAIIPNDISVPIYSGNTTYFHIFGFIVLAIITFKTFELYRFKHKYLLSSILLVLFILFTELLQLYVGYRNYSYADMGLDIIGSIIGWGIYRWIFYKP